MVKAHTLFEARSAPLSSLDARGFRILATLICAAFAATGVLFTLMGAWPVLIFAGAEAVLVVALLALYRQHAARSAELVMLHEGRITVRRREGRRIDSASFDPFWAKLRWEGPRLLLGHREASIEIGRFLTAEDKEDLARQLESALRSYRSPRFDNPQLRE
jgi:uncharacterized membrane protein